MSKLGERFYGQQAVGLDFPRQDMPAILNGEQIPLLLRGQQWNLFANDPEMTEAIDDRFHDQVRLLDPYLDPFEDSLNNNERVHHIEPVEGRMIRGHFRTNFGVVTRLTLEAIDPDEVPDSAKERLLVADEHLYWPTRTIGGVVLRGEGLFSPILTDRYPEEMIRFVTLSGLHFDNTRRKIRTTSTLLDYSETFFIPSMRFDHEAARSKIRKDLEILTAPDAQERPTVLITRKLGEEALQADTSDQSEAPAADSTATAPVAKLTAETPETKAAKTVPDSPAKKAPAKKAPSKQSAAKKAASKKAPAQKTAAKKTAAAKKTKE